MVSVLLILLSTLETAASDYSATADQWISARHER